MIAYEEDLYQRLVDYLSVQRIDNISLLGSVHIFNNQSQRLKDGEESELNPSYLLLDIDTGSDGQVISGQRATKHESTILEILYISQAPKTLSVADQIQFLRNATILGKLMAAFSWGDFENVRPLNFLGRNRDKDYDQFYQFIFKYKFYFEDYQNVIIKSDFGPGIVPEIILTTN